MKYRAVIVVDIVNVRNEMQARDVLFDILTEHEQSIIRSVRYKLLSGEIDPDIDIEDVHA